MTHPKNQERCLHTEDLFPIEEQSNNRAKTMNQRKLVVKYTIEMTQEINWAVGEGENELTTEGLICNLSPEVSDTSDKPVIMSITEDGDEVFLPGISAKESLHNLIQKCYFALITQSPGDAIGSVAGLLIGISEMFIQAKGENPNKEISLEDTSSGRKITIGAKK